MGNCRPTQCELVLMYLKHMHSITQREATAMGIMRLASRISELKKQGYIFTRDMIKVENRAGEACHVARYILVEDGHAQK